MSSSLLQEQHDEAIETIRKQEEELSMVKTELERSSVSLTQLNKENETLANDIYDLIAENEELTESFDSLYGVTKQLKQKNKKLSKKVEQLASQLEEEHYDEDYEVQAGKQEELKHKIVALTREKHDLEELVKHVTDAKDDMHDEYCILASENTLLTKDVAERDALILDLRRSIETGVHHISNPVRKIGSFSQLAPSLSNTDAASVVSRTRSVSAVSTKAENASRRLTQASTTIISSVKSMMQSQSSALFQEDEASFTDESLAASRTSRKSSLSLSDLNRSGLNDLFRTSSSSSRPAEIVRVGDHESIVSHATSSSQQSQLFEDFNTSRRSQHLDNGGGTIDEASSCCGSTSDDDGQHEQGCNNPCAFIGWDDKKILHAGHDIRVIPVGDQPSLSKFKSQTGAKAA